MAVILTPIDSPSGMPGGLTQTITVRNAAGAVPIQGAIVRSAQAGATRHRNGAAFVGARSTLAGVRKLKDGQGNYLYGMKLTDGAFVETVFNFPVIEAEDMPTIAANAYPLAFGNFKAAYIIVDRQGVRTLVDPYTDKPFVQFYTTKRTGGGLVNGEAVKVLKMAAA